MSTDTNTSMTACELQAGDLLYDPVKAGTHGQRVLVQWIGRHARRKRTYVAGVEERSLDPVTLAYDDTDEVKVYR